MKYKKPILAALSFIIALNLTACSSKFLDNSNSEPSSSASSDTKNTENNSDDYIATFGSEKIMLSEFNFYLNIVKKDMLTKANIDPDDANAAKAYWAKKEGNEDNMTLAKNKTIESIKDLKILLYKAKEEKVQLNNEDLSEVKSFVDSAIQQEGDGDKAKAESKLKETLGVTLAQYEAIYKDYLLAYMKYANEFYTKVDITDDEIKDYFNKNTDMFNKVVVKHCLLLTQDQTTGQPLSEDKVKEKENLAKEILDKAKSGTDFDSLVKQYTEDLASKEKNGEYIFGKGEMVQEFEDWSFSAKPGDLGMVKTTYGYHVMKFIRKATLEDQKEDAKAAAQMDKFKKQMDELKNSGKFELKLNQKVFDSVKF